MKSHKEMLELLIAEVQKAADYADQGSDAGMNLRFLASLADILEDDLTKPE